MRAEELLSKIAENESIFKANPGQYFGFIEKLRKRAIDFVWTRSGNPVDLTITPRGVVASRRKFEGRTWYFYTLDPFGSDVGYMETDQLAHLLLKKFITHEREVVVGRKVNHVA